MSHSISFIGTSGLYEGPEGERHDGICLFVFYVIITLKSVVGQMKGRGRDQTMSVINILFSPYYRDLSLTFSEICPLWRTGPPFTQ